MTRILIVDRGGALRFHDDRQARAEAIPEDASFLARKKKERSFSLAQAAARAAAAARDAAVASALDAIGAKEGAERKAEAQAHADACNAALALLPPAAAVMMGAAPPADTAAAAAASTGTGTRAQQREAAEALRRLADDHKHPRAAVAYGRCLEHGLGVRAVDEAAALKYFSQAAAQTRRATAEVDVAAREAGQAAAYSLMQRMHLRKAREGLGATQRAAAAAGVTSTGGRFAAKVVHTEKARAEEE